MKKIRTLLWRGPMQEAPDIDGKIFIEGAKGLRVGDFVNVQIDQGFTYEAVSLTS